MDNGEIQRRLWENQAEKTTKPDGAASRLLRALLRGAKRGFNPNDPIGLDRETILSLRKRGRMFDRTPYLPGLGAFNEAVTVLPIALGDTVLRGLNATIHGSAALAGQAANEIGLGNGRALERDLINMTRMAGFNIGRAPAALARMQSAARMAKGANAKRTLAKQFIANPRGGINLGTINPEIAKASRGKFPQAPIRMQRGFKGERGYGAQHITPDKHKRARDLGYGDGVDLIRDVAKDYNVAVEQINGRLMLVKRNGVNRYLIAQYQPNKGWIPFKKPDPYYGVTTGFAEMSKRNVANPIRNSLNRELTKRKGKMLWERKN